jgi:CheY-like chemotaxis protein
MSKPVEPGLTGTETVLMVDDNEPVRTAIALLLGMCGYKVLQASRGSEALDLSQDFQGTIHLLLTDMMMPQMNGLELSRRLRSLRPKTKVLLMSGYPLDTFEEQESLDENLILVQKPVAISVLLQKIRELLSKGDCIS